MRSTVRGFVAGVLFMSFAAAAPVQAEEVVQFDLPSQTLLSSLSAVGERAGINVLASSSSIAGIRAPALHGQMTADQAFRQLLAGSGLKHEFLDEKTVTFVPAASQGISSIHHGSGLHGGAGPLRLAYDAESASAGEGTAESAAAGNDQSEPSADESDKRMEVVVVGAKRKFAPTDSSAATKIPMSVIDTPQSITVISRELMDMTGADSFGAVAALAPNTLNGNRDIDVFFRAISRGFPVDNRQGYKINGSPIVNSGMIIDFDMVERVDMVRGPSSIVYGQSDYGSTINLQLKAPRKEFGYIGSFTLSSQDKRKIMSDVTGPLTEDGRLRGRLVTSYDATESGLDIAFMKTLNIAPSLTYDISESTRLDVGGFYATRKLQESYGFPLTQGLQLPDVKKSDFFGAAWGVTNQDTAYLNGNLLHDFGNGMNLSTMVTYSDAFNAWREPFLDGLIDTNGGVDLLGFNEDHRVTALTGTTTLNGRFSLFGRTHEFMLDGFYRTSAEKSVCCDLPYLGRVNIHDFNPWSIPETPMVPGLPQYRQDEMDLAFGGLVLLHPVERLTIMGGLRWTYYKNEPRGEQGWFGANVAFNDSAVVPKVGVVYTAVENKGSFDQVNLYSSYSEGVLFRRAQTADSSNFIGLLPPESGVQWEFGGKAAMFGNKLNLALSYFTIARNNVAAPDPDHPNEPISIGIDGQKHSGVEFEAIGEPIPGWNIYASYSYLDVSVTDAPFPAMIGHQRANSPHHQAKLYSSYEVLSGPLQGLSVGGGVIRISNREADNFGTLKLPAYTRLDARVAYDVSDHLTLSLSGINLTDADIITSAFDHIYNAIAYQDYRTVLAEITLRY